MQSLYGVVVFFGLAAGLFLPRPQNYEERYHDVTFEYHPNPHVILVKSQTECYFIRVDEAMLQQIKVPATRYALEDKIYHQIQDHTGETQTGVQALAADLHDLRAAYECMRHQVYELTLDGETSTTQAAPTTTTTSGVAGGSTGAGAGSTGASATSFI